MLIFPFRNNVVIIGNYLLFKQRNIYKLFAFDNLSATTEGMKLFGIKAGDSWLKTGLSLTVIISLVTGIFMFFQLKNENISELFRISKTNFNILSNSPDFGDKICRFASEGLFLHKQQQQIDILTKTAKERYVELQTKQTSLKECLRNT